ncbi:hypothetical protein ETR_02599 [Erwinia tracheiphila PSU-1]|nr:hypothetical protein ETR_02599 [Erwinia tracheiphila PSU-1]
MDEKKLKALAAELAKGLKTEADLNQFSRMLTKLTVETALNAELTDHLGHEKNAPKTFDVVAVTQNYLQGPSGYAGGYLPLHEHHLLWRWSAISWLCQSCYSWENPDLLSP